jgi:hypothetical protein
MIDNKLATKAKVAKVFGELFAWLLAAGVMLVILGTVLYYILLAIGVVGLSLVVDGGMPVLPVAGVTVHYPQTIKEDTYVVDFNIPTRGSVTKIDLKKSTITSTEVVIDKNGKTKGSTQFQLAPYHASEYDRYFLEMKGQIHYCITSVLDYKDNCDTREGAVLLYQSAK